MEQTEQATPFSPADVLTLIKETNLQQSLVNSPSSASLAATETTQIDPVSHENENTRHSQLRVSDTASLIPLISPGSVALLDEASLCEQEVQSLLDVNQLEKLSALFRNEIQLGTVLAFGTKHASVFSGQQAVSLIVDLLPQVLQTVPQSPHCVKEPMSPQEDVKLQENVQAEVQETEIKSEKEKESRETEVVEKKEQETAETEVELEKEEKSEVNESGMDKVELKKGETEDEIVAAEKDVVEQEKEKVEKKELVTSDEIQVRKTKATVTTEKESEEDHESTVNVTSPGMGSTNDVHSSIRSRQPIEINRRLATVVGQRLIHELFTFGPLPVQKRKFDAGKESLIENGLFDEATTLYRLSRDTLLLGEFSGSYLDNFVQFAQDASTGVEFRSDKFMFKKFSPENKVFTEKAFKTWCQARLSATDKQSQEILHLLLQRRVIEKLTLIKSYKFI